MLFCIMVISLVICSASVEVQGRLSDPQRTQVDFSHKRGWLTKLNMSNLYLCKWVSDCSISDGVSKRCYCNVN